jgi:hypothetical protein
MILKQLKEVKRGISAGQDELAAGQEELKIKLKSTYVLPRVNLRNQ